MTEKEMFENVDQSKKEELRDKVFACKTAEEAYALLKNAGMKGTLDDFKAYVSTLKKKEISHDELSHVAGGGIEMDSFYFFDRQNPPRTSKKGC